MIEPPETGQSRIDPPRPGETAATIVADDPQTADLLRRHNAGEKLSASEYGKIGAFASKEKRRWYQFLSPGKNQPGPGSPGTVTEPGQSPSMASLAPYQTPGDGLAVPEIDPGLCRRTASALLERGDAFSIAWIEREAQAAGAHGPILDRFRDAAALAPSDKKLLVEISPDVCRELGIDPRQFAVYTAVGVLGLHAVNLWQCVGELREMRRQRIADEKIRDKLMEKGDEKPKDETLLPRVDGDKRKRA